MRTARRSIALLTLAALCAGGCSGRGCSRASSPGPGPAVQPLAETPVPDASATVVPPSPPPPAGRLDVLTQSAILIPVSARVVITFPAGAVRAMLEELPALWPRVVRAVDWASFGRRIQDLWGVVAASASGQCILVVMPDSAVYVACESVKTTPLSGSHRWKEGEAEGFIVHKGGRETFVGTLGTRLLAGDPAGIRAAIATVRRARPSLADALPRMSADLRELAAADGRRSAAAWFLDRTAAPWCAEGCRRTAAFWSPEGYTAVVIADPGHVEAAHAFMDSWWDILRREFRKVAAATLEGTDTAPGATAALPEDAVKRADEVVSSGQVTVRGDRVQLAGQGDPAWLALVLRMDLLSTFFGDEKRTAP